MSRSAYARPEAGSFQRTLMTMLMLSTLALATVALAGCNTMRGAGEDVSAAGNAVSNTAEKTKQSM